MENHHPQLKDKSYLHLNELIAILQMEVYLYRYYVFQLKLLLSLYHLLVRMVAPMGLGPIL